MCRWGTEAREKERGRGEAQEADLSCEANRKAPFTFCVLLNLVHIRQGSFTFNEDYCTVSSISLPLLVGMSPYFHLLYEF